jgi:lipopolysaccharide/colanic/teichoic acid biosynthesis glycosyltransferase
VGPVWTGDRAEVETHDGNRAVVRDISRVELAEERQADPAPAEIRPGYELAKRAFDIVTSLVVLLVSLPVFAVVALCIIAEDGRPVFYGHLRQGRGGRRFRCWKFRTMYRKTDKLTAELAKRNRCDGPQVFIKDDPRVTRVGHLLRRFQIDEFPQFWNTLVGQMSIVGPRPSPDEENQYCPAWRDQRLSVRPGITGLWQTMRTRAEGQDFQEWIKYDMDYVRRASLWLDLRICVKTVWVLLRGRGNGV